MMDTSKALVFIKIWEQGKKLVHINPDDPVWVDVINNINIFELFALMWQQDLLDKELFYKMYRKVYIEIYDEINKCKGVPYQVASGSEMLKDCPVISELYAILRNKR